MIANQWTPQMKFENDIAIIDTILHTQKENAGSSKFISNQHILYANACQLWLRVTLLSNITKDDNLIDPIYFHGINQSNPPQAWHAWKSLLRQCFVTNRDIPMPTIPLYCPLGHQTQPYRPFTWDLTLHLRGKLIMYIFSYTPTHWQAILAPIEWPDDKGRTLFCDINQQHTPTCAYPNGTVLNGKGAHAYTICSNSNDTSKCIKGAGRSPGDQSVHIMAASVF